MIQRDGRAGVVAAYAGMCAIWGTTWLAIKVSLHYLPPMTGVGLRFAIAGSLLYAVAAASGAFAPFATSHGSSCWCWHASLFGLNYVLTYVAETRLDSGLVAVLFGTLPFFVFAFGHALANERTTPRIWFGAVVAFAGVAVISLAGAIRGSPLFALAAVAAAAVSAFGNVYAKRHSHHDPLLTLPPAMLLAGLAVGALGLTFERPHWDLALKPESLAALLYLAILGSGVAFFLNLWVLHRVAAWIVGLSALIIPVIAVAVGILLGGETFTRRELIGCGLVVLGIWIALSQRESAPPPAYQEP